MTGPRLAEGLEVVQLANGVAVVNGGPPVLFQGRAVNRILLPLLAALDGTLNAAGLAAKLDLAPHHVERALELLAQKGLLQDA